LLEVGDSSLLTAFLKEGVFGKKMIKIEKETAKKIVSSKFLFWHYDIVQ